MFPADEDEENAEGDGVKGKSKAPNLTRLIKSRLQKLVDKTDETYVLSTVCRPFFLIVYVADGFSRQNSWNCLRRRIGLHITKR